ncbi:OmpW family outer membrane protein [Psychrobium sp. nBUS_13]|uniref:OmpW family outer membrane protein n=1 Tax=Psychrobium sp. nBUS_13 TaxID=3395319 RepID=UPI003EBD17A5
MKKTLTNIAIVAALAATSSVAMANKAGDMIARVGAVNVTPSSDKATIYAGGNKVDLGAGALTASVESETQLGLNFVYFATDKIAVELLGSVDLLSSFLQQFVWGFYKAEPMWCSWLHE